MKRQMRFPQEVGVGLSEPHTWQHLPRKGQPLLHHELGTSRDRVFPAQCYAPRKYLYREGKLSFFLPHSLLFLFVREILGAGWRNLALCPLAGSKHLLSVSLGYDTPFLEYLCASDILIYMCPKRPENHLMLPCIISSLPPSKVSRFFQKLFIEV